MTTEFPIRMDIDGHVASIVLNRPEKKNRMGLDFFPTLETLVQKAEAEPDVRAIILRAEGSVFTAGLDLMEAGALLTDASASGRETLRKHILKLQQSFSALEMCSKPVIAAVNGPCIGGGVDLISACDIRIASDDAYFSIRETRVAIIADLGTLQRLHHIVGYGRAAELALTGRDFTAKEACEMGLLSRCLPDPSALMEAAGQIAADIASLSPLAVQGVKDVLRFSRDHDIATGLAYVAQKNAALLLSEDLMEAFAAFSEKRVPQFKGR
ncbi:crotonase/enoyl-CoA hydratase family protein [Desulfatirhabdium butyrativorans]|uniref:crotonase/enoyl-CoA hydratase family protein n=1 Tax=Desulfatirhabdium butyrativorans TaxID=340467 RepID=UPI00041B7CE2|nr:crotonase/enoyl-CoA hydratase family protein [Desulfatirhabdium butyrativorans]